MANRKISEGRQTLHFIGLALIVIGMLTFLSTFVTAAMNFGNFSNFDGQVQSSAFRAIAGMIMIMLGGVLANIGRAGLAGSGVVLDPEQAREDLEPWNRMAGGMTKDFLDEAEIDLSGLGAGSKAAPDFADQLRKLHALREEGILTEAEYEREKAEILERN